MSYTLNPFTKRLDDRGKKQPAEDPTKLPLSGGTMTGNIGHTTNVGVVTVGAYDEGQVRNKGVRLENPDGYAILSLKGKGDDAGRIRFQSDNFTNPGGIVVFQNDVTLNALDELDLTSTLNGRGLRIKGATVVPKDDNFNDLGTPSFRWKSVNAVAGVFTGNLTVQTEPTADSHVATKKYVDDNSGGGISNLDGGSSSTVYLIEQSLDGGSA